MTWYFFLTMLMLCAVSALALCYCSQKLSKEARKGWLRPAVQVVLVISTGFFFSNALPGVFYWLVYEGLWCGFVGWLLPIVVPAAPFAFLALKKASGKDNPGMAIFLCVVGVMAALVAWVSNDCITEWRMAHMYKPELRDAMVKCDSHRIRATCFEVAVRNMIQHCEISNYGIEPENVWPAEIDGCSGYAAPVTASGWYLQTFGGTPALMTYRDSAELGPNGRAHMEDPEGGFRFAPDRQIFDNIFVTLHLADPLAEFEEVYPEYLGSEPVFIAPKIRRVPTWPWVMVPKWAGAVIVYRDGRAENLSVAKVLSDERLKNKMVFPMRLVRRMVLARNYDSPGGFFPDLWQGLMPNKNRLEIPKVEGFNEQPYVYPAEDGKTYFLVVTEPEGAKSNPVKGYHYIDASTGEYTWCPPKKSTIGPSEVIRVAKASRTGNRWGSVPENFLEKLSSEGDGAKRDVKALALEPMPLSLDGENCVYLVNITSTEYSNVGEFLFVNGTTQQPRGFHDQAEFLALMERGIMPTVNDKAIADEAKPGEKPQTSVETDGARKESPADGGLREVLELGRENQATLRSMLGELKLMRESLEALKKERTNPPN